jgi:hypothetical protein
MEEETTAAYGGGSKLLTCLTFTVIKSKPSSAGK